MGNCYLQVTAIISPASTRKISPTCTSSGGIIVSTPSQTTLAVRGVIATRFSIPSRALRTVAAKSWYFSAGDIRFQAAICNGEGRSMGQGGGGSPKQRTEAQRGTNIERRTLNAEHRTEEDERERRTLNAERRTEEGESNRRHDGPFSFWFSVGRSMFVFQISRFWDL